MMLLTLISVLLLLIVALQWGRQGRCLAFGGRDLVGLDEFLALGILALVRSQEFGSLLSVVVTAQSLNQSSRQSWSND